jgi:hypothetical protein
MMYDSGKRLPVGHMDLHLVQHRELGELLYYLNDTESLGGKIGLREQWDA